MEGRKEGRREGRKGKEEGEEEGKGIKDIEHVVSTYLQG